MVALSSFDASLSGQAERLAHQHGVRLPLADQPAAFLRTAWQAMPAGQLVGLMADDEYFQAQTWQIVTSPKWSFWPEGLDHLLGWAHAKNAASYHNAGRGGIYWHAASRKNAVLGRYGARGGLDDLLAITAFFADLDVAKRGYDLERALAALLAMPLPPTFVVFSGGGLQAVHVLSEPWAVTNREAAKEYKAYSLALYRSVFERTGLVLDSAVAEASRMMRSPGFANRKTEYTTSPVARIVYHGSTLYSVDAIKTRVQLPQNTPETRARLFAPLGIQAKETYQVGQEFIHYLVDREPQSTGTPPGDPAPGYASRESRDAARPVHRAHAPGGTGLVCRESRPGR
jgi:hypothetical protein